MLFLRLSWLWLGLISLACQADDENLRVEVAAPYIELHTGPGVTYPVDQVVERGEWVEVLKRRTDWFQVRTRRDHRGWVHLTEMQQTKTADGEPLQVGFFTLDDFRQREWEFGFLGGDMEGADLLSVYGGYHFNENLSAELSVSQATGNFSSEYLADVNLLSHPFPEWRYSPFFTLGSGVIRTQPNATLVQTEDRTDTTAHVGVGLHAYFTRRFFLRAEFRHYTVFTSRNDNEEFNQWKIGFGFFF
ncbi:MAG: outer membrane beta-barrel protein [Candidatus Thiodiazotropha sp.]